MGLLMLMLGRQPFLHLVEALILPVKHLDPILLDTRPLLVQPTGLISLYNHVCLFEIKLMPVILVGGFNMIGG